MPPLFTEFEPTTAAQWKEQLVKDLKGIDYQSLVWTTNSGLEIQPFYTADDLSTPHAPLFTNPDWAICEYIDVAEAGRANTLALHALQNGASGLVFRITEAVDYETLVKDISLPHIYSLFIVPETGKPEAEAFLRSANPAGTSFVESDGLLPGQAPKPGKETFCLDLTPYQEAGANTVNELACALAHLNEYLEACDSRGSLSTVHLRVSVGGDFFMEIAKLRALRKLATFLLEQQQCDATLHLHAQTTGINKSPTDSYNNMLRSATEAMSAAIGGANSVTVFPFDRGFKEANAFSARMARNQQLILKDESYLNLVADIAAGSYYLETLTDTLCKKAWEGFKTIESKGGLIACLQSGYIRDLIGADAEALIAAFRDGSLVLVGVNKFQNKNETSIISRNAAPVSPYGLTALRLSDYVA